MQGVCFPRAIAACLLVLVILVVPSWLPGSLRAFGVVGQADLRKKQERDGLVVHTPAAASGLIPLSSQGKKLLGIIMKAQEWYPVQKLIDKYTGNEIQIFNAVLQKALSLRRYKQGAAIYQTLCNNNVGKQRATMTAAITIFSRLGRPDVVQNLWEEVQHTCGMDSILAAARIRAAASEGDIETAAAILDDMKRTNIDINVVHVSSAIRACWTAEGRHHNAAKYMFYKVLPSLDLQPNRITFNNFLGALRGAPLTDILPAYNRMKAMDISPDAVTAETFLMSLFPKPREERWDSAAAAAARLRDGDAARLEAARSAIRDFKASHVELSELSHHIDGALQLLAAEG